MTLIAQITDPHLRDDGADPCHDPADALRRAFAMIAAMELKPAAIVLTGDIIDRSARSYDHVMHLLAEAPVPLLPLSGNHDRADEFRAAFAGWADFADGHLSFARPVGAMLLVGLDSNLPGASGGVDRARLDWLRGVLANARSPVILALHHPPFSTHAPHLDKGGFEGAGDLEALVRDSPVCRIIAGHSHRGMQTLWAGVPASTAIAIGHGLSLSLSGARHTPIPTTPGYELHHLHHGTLVSHQMLVA
ncbi:MAG: metallophosphoesterase [Hoeflea sp.]|uniref:metallophosphoesterase n=1 Tax=Hoeflea sp. TaxID=1940281 RepID=UPI001E1282AC|nr:metallophosphoesterase [Hoeflea sp.]MBU4529626.1 metallophosphoesterase [Alphaproteobacteria bacterium]MBU4546745.1 metallophosphoesterase [Alphaproteobacteria bacterium]MBU4551013.1 metallophosphoesterase [Alphaproteobacteria bacterium]MBV1723955.1 metallophosphoesterase [Hoeflea sp.]MBV1763232.1 metallophosphoesterase [Hoeflea sp.]